MKIQNSEIIATCIYSGGGEPTEIAIEGQGVKSYCIRDCLFETNTAEDIDKFSAYIKEEGYKVVIIDNHWTPNAVTSLSKGIFDFAETISPFCPETFCLTNIKGAGRAAGELWRVRKPIQFKDMEKPVLHCVRIFTFGTALFTLDGKVVEMSGGDGDIERTEHLLHSHRGFRERDWPSIIRKIHEELA